MFAKRFVKVFVVFVLLTQSVAALTGCGGLHLAPLTEMIEYDGQTYKTGFYSDLFFPTNAAYDDYVAFDQYDFELLNGRFFHGLLSEEHRWIYTFTGAVMKVYCHIDDFEQEKAFYNDPHNFDYMLSIGNVYTPEIRHVMDGFEPMRYDALMRYVEENASFGKNKPNYVTKPIEYGYAERDKCEIRFYKKSKDNFFSSTRKHIFVAVDDRLIYLSNYRSDVDYAGKQYVCGYEIPDHIGSYFLEYVKKIQG